jgi:hypothetical protein
LLTAAGYADTYHPAVDYRVAAVDQSDNQSAYSAAQSWVYIRLSDGKRPTQPMAPR